MKLRRFQEDWRQVRTTGGREWKSGVRNSLPDAIFVFGNLLCIFVCKFCQSLLPALKMTLDGWKHVSNKHLQSKSLQSLVLCHNDTQLPLVRNLNPVVGPRKNLQRFDLAWTKFSNNTPSRPLTIRNDPSGEGEGRLYWGQWSLGGSRKIEDRGELITQTDI